MLFSTLKNMTVVEKHWENSEANKDKKKTTHNRNLLWAPLHEMLKPR